MNLGFDARKKHDVPLNWKTLASYVPIGAFSRRRLSGLGR